MMITAQVISQKRRRLIQVDDQNIQVTIIVEVSERASPAGMCGRDAWSRVVQFFECAIAQIPK
jgi:hypothetical protein